MKIITKLRERKDHFVVTLYKHHREILNCQIGDIIVLKIRDHEIIRPIRKDFQVSLPKKILFDKKHKDEVELYIKKIQTRKDSLLRPKKELKMKSIDLRSFANKKTYFGQPFYIIPVSKSFSYYWYPVGGGVKHVKLKNKIPLKEISQFLGLFYGDGTTCEGIRSFRFTNSEPSTLIFILNFLESIGITRDEIKVQIIYSTQGILTQKICFRCIEFWKNQLMVPRKNIISVTKAKNKRETLKYGSARIYFDNSVFVELMIEGILKSIEKQIFEDKVPKELLKGFFQGILAAEGAVTLRKKFSLSSVAVSFDPYSKEKQLFQKIMKKLGINYGFTKGNQTYIFGHENFKKFYNMDAFILHKKRNEKFNLGFVNHKFTSLQDIFPQLSLPFVFSFDVLLRKQLISQ